MYSDLSLIGLLVAVFVWLLVLSYINWKNRSFLSQLFPSGSERDIRKKFEEVVQASGKTDLEIKKILEKLGGLEKTSLSFIQRVELLRYNPYEDTGGDQSFSLALLDQKGNGFVITSLHSRASTRVFAKPVILGRSGKFNFSEEEAAVVKKAMES